jgi:OFA family oxalate/formate antiporter-like MFS transporter
MERDMKGRIKMSGVLQNRQGLKVLAAGAVLQLFLGIIYVWSVFKNPVSGHYGWEPGDVGLTASFMLCFFVIGILAGGKIMMRIGVRMTTLLGGMTVAAGMLATALLPAQDPVSITMHNAKAPVFLLYLFYGVAGGFGVGAAYNAIVSSAQKWFPKNRGFAVGVTACAFGASTVIFAPLATVMIEKLGVQSTFFALAMVFAAATGALHHFIRTPDDVAGAAAPPPAGKQYTTAEMIKTRRYYYLAFSLMFGTSVFFIINPDLMDLAKERGMESFATYLVMFAGIANAAGRLGAPLLSDKIGRERASMMLLSVTALGAFGLCFAQGVLLAAVIGAVAFCFGGYPGLYPVLTAEHFGIKNVGANYGAVMIGFMLSALLFPILLGRIEDQQVRFIILGVLAAAGAVLIVLLRGAKKKEEKNG